VKISALEEYGLRCMVQLARRAGTDSVTIGVLARTEGLSIPYVGKVMRALREAGLVTSERGQSGGYRLAAPPGEIRLDRVIHALSGPIYDGDFCPDHRGNALECVHTSDCGVRAVWHEVQVAIDRVLARLSLRDLVSKEETLKAQMTGARAGQAPSSLEPFAMLGSCVSCVTCTEPESADA